VKLFVLYKQYSDSSSLAAHRASFYVYADDQAHAQAILRSNRLLSELAHCLHTGFYRMAEVHDWILLSAAPVVTHSSSESPDDDYSI
jgi:hypothetical protein